MAINIKNERTVALARELAELRGVTLTSAVEEALEARLREVRAESPFADNERERRRAAIRALVAEIQANITPEQREALRTAERDMYDEDGLPVMTWSTGVHRSSVAGWSVDDTCTWEHGPMTDMRPRAVDDLDSLLSVDHPVLTYDIGSGFTPPAYVLGSLAESGAVAVQRRSDRGHPGLAVIGSADAVRGLLLSEEVRELVRLRELTHVSVPRAAFENITDVHDWGGGGEWDWMWTTTGVPTLPHESGIEIVDSATRGELVEFLRRANPRTHGEPFARLELFRPDDGTHTNLLGAQLNARCVVSGIKALAENLKLAEYLSTTAEPVTPATDANVAVPAKRAD